MRGRAQVKVGLGNPEEPSPVGLVDLWARVTSAEGSGVGTGVGPQGPGEPLTFLSLLHPSITILGTGAKWLAVLEEKDLKPGERAPPWAPPGCPGEGIRAVRVPAGLPAAGSALISWWLSP